MSTVSGVKFLTQCTELFYPLNSPTFRKMFPEYVEKYEQQQLADQLNSDQMPLLPTQGNLRPGSRGTIDNSTLVDLNKAETLKEQKDPKRQRLPAWVVFLLVSIFGIVMALPLLQS